jgi:hypothetical protein
MGTYLKFTRQVEEVATEIFNRHWGENMVAGNQVRLYDHSNSRSMPVDIAISWMAWTNPTRSMSDIAQIEKEMNTALNALFEDLEKDKRPKVQVRVSLFG